MEDEQQRFGFSDLYIRPKLPYDERFAYLCEINSGMSVAGAKRHYETLQHCPDGYTYYGEVERGKAPADAIAHDIAYSIDGELMPDYVVVFRKV